MHLLHDLAARTAAQLAPRCGVAAVRAAYQAAWRALPLVLRDLRFAALWDRLGVPTLAQRLAVRNEMIALEAQGFEIGDGLEQAGYPALAALFQREPSLLVHLAEVALGAPPFDPVFPTLLAEDVEAVECGDDLVTTDFDEDYGLRLDDEEDEEAPRRRDEPAPAAAPPPGRGRDTDSYEVAQSAREEAPPHRRRASVRWYRRMNPERMYPLTVVLAEGRLRQVSKPGVGQKTAGEQLVVTKEDPFVRVRPVLPGCLCYPDEQVVDATPKLVEVRFQVVPQVVGTIEEARVEFYQRHRLMTAVPLPLVVSRQTLAVVLGSLGVAWPVLGTMLKSAGGNEPTDLAATWLQWLLAQPHALEVGLGLGAVAAIVCWWWNRPRQASAFAGLDQIEPMTVAELLQAGQAALARGDRDEARGCAEDALNLEPGNALAADLLARSRG